MADQLVISESTINQFVQNLNNSSSGLTQRTLDPNDSATTITVNGKIHSAFSDQNTLVTTLQGSVAQEIANLKLIANEFIEIDEEVADGYEEEGN